MVLSIAGFAQSFTSHQINTNELCLTDWSGATCYTRSQLNSLLASANPSGSSPTPPSSSSNGAAASSSTNSSATPPVLQKNGDNPAIIKVGAAYTDLGAQITGPTADLNYVNGAPMNPIQLNTTQAATDTTVFSPTACHKQVVGHDGSRAFSDRTHESALWIVHS
jgi:hypothetical protein